MKKPLKTSFQEPAPMRSGYRADYEEYAREVWGPMVNDLRKENEDLKTRLFKYEYDLTQGVHAGTLMKAISENPVALEYWKKILILLRLGE